MSWIPFFFALLAIGYPIFFFLLPDPSPFRATDFPLSAPISFQNELKEGKRLFVNEITKGPETIRKRSKDNFFYTGTREGDIYRFQNESSIEHVTKVDAKVNGWDWDANGDMIIADADHGRVFRLNLETKQVSNLINEVDDVPFLFTNDVAIASNGDIYISDSSSTLPYKKDNITRQVELVLMGDTTGRLMCFSPSTGESQTLLSNLSFSNGISLSHSEDFILVCESSAYRVRRYWLKGPKAGQSEIWMDNLPGFPDNIRKAEKEGHFWLALINSRSKIIDSIQGYPRIKKLLALFGQQFPEINEKLKPPPVGMALLVDSEGKIVDTLTDSTGKIGDITNIDQDGKDLYFGNTEHPWMAKYTMK